MPPRRRSASRSSLPVGPVEPAHSAYTGIFKTIKQVEEHFYGNKNTPPQIDRPFTEDEYKEWVKLIYKSMINTEDVADGLSSIAYRRFTKTADEESYYDQKDVECTSWMIVKACVDLHTYGFTLPKEIDYAKDKVDQNLNLWDRLEAVRKLLHTEKGACREMMGAIKIPVLVNAPNASTVRKRENRNGNKRKRELIIMGKTVAAGTAPNKRPRVARKTGPVTSSSSTGLGEPQSGTPQMPTANMGATLYVPPPFRPYQPPRGNVNMSTPPSNVSPPLTTGPLSPSNTHNIFNSVSTTAAIPVSNPQAWAVPSTSGETTSLLDSWTQQSIAPYLDHSFPMLPTSLTGESTRFGTGNDQGLYDEFLRDMTEINPVGTNTPNFVPDFVSLYLPNFPATSTPSSTLFSSTEASTGLVSSSGLDQIDPRVIEIPARGDIDGLLGPAESNDIGNSSNTQGNDSHYQNGNISSLLGQQFNNGHFFRGKR